MIKRSLRDCTGMNQKWDILKMVYRLFEDGSGMIQGLLRGVLEIIRNIWDFLAAIICDAHYLVLVADHYPGNIGNR